MRTAALILALFATAPLVALASTPAPTATPAQATQQTLMRAKEWLGRMQSGNVDRSQLTAKMSEQYTDDVRATLANEVGPMGAVVAMTLKDVKHKEGSTGYLFSVTYANGTNAEYLFALEDATGKVSGLSFTPAP